MICLYAETNLSTLTFIFYSCICAPFLQLAQLVVTILNFLIDPHHQPETNYNSDHNPEWELDLPVSKFQHSSNSIDSEEEEACSICLMEFEKEDMVNKLPKCGHVFHSLCLEKWLDRCQFTCPLCRSMLLRVRSSQCKKRISSPFSINLQLAEDC